MSGSRRSLGPGDVVVVDREGLDQLVGVLRERGYRTVGPLVEDGAIVLGEVTGTADMPAGFHDRQSPGSYSLERGDDDELFGWAVGPGSLKAEVLPDRTPLWSLDIRGDPVRIRPRDDPVPALAVFGVRPCEVAALDVLSRVLDGPDRGEPRFRRRRPAVVVTAECTAPSSSCFCTSMGTGPAAREGFDIAVIELTGDAGHRFVMRIGTDLGADLMSGVDWRPLGRNDEEARTGALEAAASRIRRHLETAGLAELLARNLDHPRWEDVAHRCLSCGNCTSVCPTCFCVDIQDTTDIAGTVQREQSWASCFDLEHSYLHGGPVRASVSSRYRQWATHKLSTWWDQFGTSGCVGCGRCITWCPARIDITEEVSSIRESDGALRA